MSLLFIVAAALEEVVNAMLSDRSAVLVLASNHSDSSCVI